MRIVWVGVVALVSCGVGTAQNVSEQYLLAAANRDRAVVGLVGLRVDAGLVRAARRHAEEMAGRRTISHQFAGEADLAERAGAAGVRFSLVTENVAEAGNSAKIHELWMLSSGHRANLLDGQVDRVGIAVVQRGGQLYAVEDFARGVEGRTLEQQEAGVARQLSLRGLRVSADATAARATCAQETGYAGERRAGFVMRYTSAEPEQLPEELKARMATGRYKEGAVGACAVKGQAPFSTFRLAVVLYP